MNNAFYVTLSKQTALFRNMEVIANNLANANTTGYKAEKMLFTDYVMKNKGGEKVSFAQDIATVRNMMQGEVAVTNSAFDAAIQGKGFFMVNTPDGIRYSRAGSFGMNSQGELVNSNGYRVGDSGGGPLIIPENATDITIRDDGMIQAFVDGKEEEIGKLGITKFPDDVALKIDGNGLYRGEGGTIATEEDFKIIHKSLETSNVNPVGEITQMIEVSRSVSSTATMVKDMHDMLRRAIETISKQA